jgi:hypothetical protein
MTFQQLMEHHPLTMVHRDSANPNSTTEEATRKYRSATKNMAEIFSSLSPILPTVED